MKLHNSQTLDSHPIGRLPLFVNRTLPESEKKEIYEHIKMCPSCQTELSEWEALASAVKGQEADNPDISLAWSRTERRFNTERRPINPSVEKKDRPPFIRWFFPSFAWGLVAVQGIIIIIGLMVYILESRKNGDVWRTLGEKTAAIKKDDIRLQVVFQQDAKASDIADLLSKVEGQIVSGPSNQGVFEISIPLHIVKKNSMDSVLKLFRQRTDVVRWVQTDETM